MNIARRLSQAAESGIGIKLGIGLAIITTLLLGGCGGGGTPTTTAQTLSGTAAQGLPITSTAITVKDKNGVTKTGTTGTDGKYSIDVTGLATPLLLRISTGNGYLYSVATTTGTANIHPFTDLIIRDWYSVQGANVEADFVNVGALNKVPTTTEINTIEAVVNKILSTNLSNAGLPSNFNLLTSSFDANQTGFDQVLDNTKVAVNSSTGGITVTATDASTGITGTIVSTAAAIDTTVADTQKPTDPTGLAVLPASTSSVVLTWNASSDNVGVAGYNIYRDGSYLNKSPYPVYTDTGLSQTLHCYQVEAFDGAGNISASKSGSTCAAPASTADTTPPTAPTNLLATAASASQIDIAWAASTSADVAGYAIYRGAFKVATVTGTSFSDTGLSSATAYTYTVQARDGAGNFSSASNSSTATTNVGIPSAPTNITPAAGNGQTTISWTAAAGATSYNIYWSTTPGVTIASGTKISGITGSTYTHSGTASGTTYYYIVTAVNSSGESVESAQASATLPPAAPATVTATAGNGQASISWTAVSGATSYNLYWSTTSGAGTSGTKVPNVTSAYPLTGLTNGTPYYFVVTAVNGGGESAASAQQTATPLPPLPTPPIGVTATAGDGQVNVSWSPITGATSYNLYYSTSSGVTKTNGAKITGASSPYTHTGLNNGMPYYYIVAAVNMAGEGVASAQATATPVAAVVAGAHTNSGTYTWNASTSQLVLNTTSANLCGHTTLGTETMTGVTITATTLAYTNGRGYPDSWNRPSGTAGNLLGSWPTTDNTNGVLYTLTFNANNTFSITAVEGTCSTGTTATAANFWGPWTGSITMNAPATATQLAENSNCSLGVMLNYSGSTVTGTVTASSCNTGTPSIFTISGTVANGVLSFNLPNSNPTNPDCANWNMPVTATLSTDLKTVTINSSGTVCGAGGGKPGTITGTATGVAATGTGLETNGASGTYTWNAATSTLLLNFTSSDFVSTCAGPGVGMETKMPVSITATTMTWTDLTNASNSMVFTGGSGTAGVITGIWSYTDSQTGNRFILTFNANGTMFVGANVVACNSGGGSATAPNPNVHADAMNASWAGGYYVEMRYDDPTHAATAVSVSGPGITGSATLTYNAGQGSWTSYNTQPASDAYFGSTYPSGLPYTYTFSITDATGTWTTPSTVSCFQQQFVTNLLPTGTATGTPTFSWTGINDTNVIYSVELDDSNHNGVAFVVPISGTSYVYNGPALTPGVTYQYYVGVQGSATCGNGTSLVQGSFTYQ